MIANFYLNWPANFVICFVILTLIAEALLFEFVISKDPKYDHLALLPLVLVNVFLVLPVAVFFSLSTKLTIDGVKSKVILSQKRLGCIPLKRKEYDLKSFEGCSTVRMFGCSNPESSFGKKCIILNFSDGKNVNIMPGGKIGAVNDNCFGTLQNFVDGVNECVNKIKSEEKSMVV